MYCYTGKQGDFTEGRDQVLTAVKDLHLLKANTCWDLQMWDISVFETATKLKTRVLWMTYRVWILDSYRRFEETYCFTFQSQENENETFNFVWSVDS